VLKVVLIDDSYAIRRSVGRLLASVPGVDVVGFAADVAGACRIIDSQCPDVVVLDVDLNGQEHGMDVLSYVVRRHPYTKVVGFSNFTVKSARDGFMQAGASAYFDKSTEFAHARDFIAALRPPARAPEG